MSRSGWPQGHDTPTAGTDRSATFTVDRDIRLYGGFAGTETMRSERDPISNVTILSGEIGAPGNADNSYHVVTTVPPVDGVVDGFTISGGKADGVAENKGGGIYAGGGKITIGNVLFTDNAADLGGGLYVMGVAVGSDLDFIANTADVDGGGLAAEHISLNTCTFQNNMAAQNGGGAHGQVSANGCEFVSNSSGGQGGGAYGTTSANGCEFVGNSAGGDGGGVYATAGGAQNCLFEDNTSMGNGGGVYAAPGTLKGLNNCNVASNTAVGDGGGAYGWLTVDMSTVMDNQADGSGGGLYVTRGQVLETTIQGNVAAQDGGGVYLSPAYNMLVSGCDFINNGAAQGGGVYSRAIEDEIWECMFDGNTAALGAGIYNESAAPFRMVKLVLLNNMATDRGGAVYNEGAGAELLNSLVVDNTATNEGGGLYAAAAATVVNVTFNGNAAGSSGGGVQNADSLTEIANTILWTNAAPTNPDIAGTPPLISYSDVAGCGESGLTWDPSVGVDGGFNIDEDPKFVDEPGDDFHLQAQSRAVNGGDDVLDGDLTTDLDDNPRLQCKIDMGPYERPTTVTPSNIRFVTPDGNGDGTSWGCAYGNLEDALASGQAGADEVWVAAGTYVPGNYFPQSYAMSVYGGFEGWESSIAQRDVLANPTILSGEVGAPGHEDNRHLIIRISGSPEPRVLDGFVVTGGNSLDDGGGIRIVDGCVAIVRNCVIIDNQASSSGGGLYWKQSTGNGDLQITNCIFVDNWAQHGGGCYLQPESDDSHITNSTFYNNSATVQGGAIYSPWGQLTNSIVWGNTAPLDPQVAGGFTLISLDVSHSLIEGSGGSGALWDDEVGSDLGGNIDADPMFVDAPGGNFRILLGSPALNTGDNSTPYLPATDIDGNPRVTYFTVDMGAHENSEVASGIDDKPIEDVLPKVTQLRALYPNPFNPTITIAFDLDRGRHIRIEVYDVKGRRVATVLDETRPAGRYDVRWDAESRGQHLASGVYFVLIRSEGWRAERKIVLLK